MVGGASVAGVVHVDSSTVRFNAFGVDVCRHRSSGIDLHHDVLVPFDTSEFRHLDDWVFLDGGASNCRIMIAIHAVVDIRAFHVNSLILLASYIWYSIVVDVTISCP